ncbi:MAG: pyridoxamine 5'-phosphate oxidase family protein [Verrucomicrobiales bacterium]|nr:pyridoxamine 5'-phosphate oxidase family protein [Verrucomicrobiales bacterium]
MPEPPKPETIDPSDLPEIARTVVHEAKFPMLASIDGDKPRVRPVSPVRVDDADLTHYIANLRSYHKTGEIEANPNIELCYLAPNHDQLRLEGKAEVVTDRAVLEEIWESNALLRRYLGSIENPELIIYRLKPERIRFMREWALEYHDVTL